MEIYSAPIQGFTDAVWRNAHERLFGGVDCYFSPFIRVEHGEIRKKDLRDIDPDNNSVAHLVPQIMASGDDDTRRMLDLIIADGYNVVDVNLGCPFPPVVKKHKGCGMMTDAERLKHFTEILAEYADRLRFSYKMRLGLNDTQEGKEAIAILDATHPELIAIHARLGVQQYKGEADVEAFAEMIDGVKSPLAYNGDISSADEIKEIESRFPQLKAVMIGRSLLSNPAMAREYRGGDALEIEEWLKLHDAVFAHYSDYLQGDAHILAKMKPYWEYAPTEIDHKVLKLIKKSTSVSKYRIARESI